MVAEGWIAGSISAQGTFLARLQWCECHCDISRALDSSLTSCSSLSAALFFKYATFSSFNLCLPSIAGLAVRYSKCSRRQVGCRKFFASRPHVDSLTCAQGIVIGSSVQAALYTATPNGLADWTGNQYGFYFMICCLAVAMVLVVLFIRKTSTTEDEFPESHEG